MSYLNKSCSVLYRFFGSADDLIDYYMLQIELQETAVFCFKALTFSDYAENKFCNKQFSCHLFSHHNPWDSVCEILCKVPSAFV